MNALLRPVVAYLGLGSNMGDPPAQLKEAVVEIGELPSTRVTRESPIYGSKPWGRLDQPDFANMVVEIRTTLGPPALLRHVKEIEGRLGRVPGERWGPRPVDIDILLYENTSLSTPELQVPHPRMWLRAFVLRPLSDLAPHLRAPDGTPILELLQRDVIASQGVWPLVEERS